MPGTSSGSWKRTISKGPSSRGSNYVQCLYRMKALSSAAIRSVCPSVRPSVCAFHESGLNNVVSDGFSYHGTLIGNPMLEVVNSAGHAETATKRSPVTLQKHSLGGCVVDRAAQTVGLPSAAGGISFRRAISLVSCRPAPPLVAARRRRLYTTCLASVELIHRH